MRFFFLSVYIKIEIRLFVIPPNEYVYIDDTVDVILYIYCPVRRQTWRFVQPWKFMSPDKLGNLLFVIPKAEGTLIVEDTRIESMFFILWHFILSERDLARKTCAMTSQTWRLEGDMKIYLPSM